MGLLQTVVSVSLLLPNHLCLILILRFLSISFRMSQNRCSRLQPSTGGWQLLEDLDLLMLAIFLCKTYKEKHGELWWPHSYFFLYGNFTQLLKHLPESCVIVDLLTKSFSVWQKKAEWTVSPHPGLLLSPAE